MEIWCKPIRPLLLISLDNKRQAIDDLLENGHLYISKKLLNDVKIYKDHRNYLRKEYKEICIDSKELWNIIKEDAKENVNRNIWYLPDIKHQMLIYYRNVSNNNKYYRYSLLISIQGIMNNIINILEIRDILSDNGGDFIIKDLIDYQSYVYIGKERKIYNSKTSIKQLYGYKDMILFRSDMEIGLLKIPKVDDFFQKEQIKLELNPKSKQITSFIQKKQKKIIAGCYSSTFVLLVVLLENMNLIISQLNMESSILDIPLANQEPVMDLELNVGIEFVMEMPIVLIVNEKNSYFFECWKPYKLIKIKGFLYNSINGGTFDFKCDLKLKYMKYISSTDNHTIAINRKYPWLIAISNRHKTILKDIRSYYYKDIDDNRSEYDLTNLPLVEWEHHLELQPPDRLTFIDDEISKDQYGIIIWNRHSKNIYVGFYYHKNPTIDELDFISHSELNIYKCSDLINLPSIAHEKGLLPHDPYREAYNYYYKYKKAIGTLDNVEVILHHQKERIIMTIIQIHHDNLIFTSSVEILGIKDIKVLLTNTKNQIKIPKSIFIDIKQGSKEDKSLKEIEEHTYSIYNDRQLSISYWHEKTFKIDKIVSIGNTANMDMIYFNLLSIFSKKYMTSDKRFVRTVLDDMTNYLKTYLTSKNIFNDENELICWNIFKLILCEVSVPIFRYRQSFRGKRIRYVQIRNRVKRIITDNYKLNRLGPLYKRSMKYMGNQLLYYMNNINIDKVYNDYYSKRENNLDKSQKENLIKCRKTFLNFFGLQKKLDPEENIWFIESGSDFKSIIRSYDLINECLHMISIYILNPYKETIFPQLKRLNGTKNTDVWERSLVKSVISKWDDGNYKDVLDIIEESKGNIYSIINNELLTIPKLKTKKDDVIKEVKEITINKKELTKPIIKIDTIDMKNYNNEYENGNNNDIEELAFDVLDDEFDELVKQGPITRGDYIDSDEYI